MRDSRQRHSLNKVDQSLIVDMMHIKKNAALLMLQPDGFTKSNLTGISRALHGVVAVVYHHRFTKV